MVISVAYSQKPREDQISAFATVNIAVATPGEEQAARRVEENRTTRSPLQNLADRVSAVLNDPKKGYPFNDYFGNFFIIEDKAGQKIRPEIPDDLKRPSFSGPATGPGNYHNKINDFALRLKDEGCAHVPPDLQHTLTVSVVVSIDLPSPANKKSNEARAAELAAATRRLLPAVNIDIAAKPLTRAELADRINNDNWQVVQSALSSAVDSNSKPLSLSPDIRTADGPENLAIALKASNASQPIFFPAVWGRQKGEPSAEETAMQAIYDDFRKAKITTSMDIGFDHGGIYFRGTPQDLQRLSDEHPLVLHHGPTIEPLIIEQRPGGKGLIILQSTGEAPKAFDNITQILQYTKGESFSIELSKGGTAPGVEIVSAYPVVQGLRTAHDLNMLSIAFLYYPNRDQPADLKPDEWPAGQNAEAIGMLKRILMDSAGKGADQFIEALQAGMLNKKTSGRKKFPNFRNFTPPEKKFLGALHDYYNARSDANLKLLCDAMGLSVREGTYSKEKINPTLDLMAEMGPKDRGRLRNVLELADKNHYKECGPASVIYNLLSTLDIPVLQYSPVNRTLEDASREKIHGVVEAKDLWEQQKALGEEAVRDHLKGR